MRTIILLSLLIGFASCHAQSPHADTVTRFSDWRLDPYSPALDTLKSRCSISSETLTRVQKNDTVHCDLYYLNGKLFTGWACEIFRENKHTFRFELYEAGMMIRRIGYYDNGRLDFDFRMKDCKNYGPSRMWLYDDGMYLDEFYAEPGVKHGIHKRWHNNGILAREAKYDNGVPQYDKVYDRAGQLISEK